MQFTHAIFDMDGTLVDSMGYWDEVCAEFLKELGVYSEEVFDKLKPMTVPQTADYLRSEFGITRSAQEVTERMYRLMRAHYQNDVLPKPGIRTFLEALQQKGVRFCVASSSPVDLVQICLDRHGLTKYFDFMISGEDVGKGKDQPDIYLKAAERLGGAPQNTLVFEDAMIAGCTAKRAGFLTAAIYDVNSEAEWEAFSAQTDVAFRDWYEALQNL